MSSGLADIATELPYPGLRPFEPHEADIFFGRKQHITELLTRLKNHRFLGVVGPSGCGKSSLIRAGLIPALHGGFLARSKRHWRCAVLRPGNQPLQMLANSLCESGIFGDPKGDVVPDALQLREDLEAGSRSLANRLIMNQSAQDKQLLILVDQFEELFRFEREGGGDESRAFVNLLLETARDTAASAYIVLTMRTDFLGQCPVFAGLPEALNESQYLTPRLTRDQIESAIVGPARLFGGEVDEDVVARILNEMGTDPDQLPLMQHLLMRMWRSATRRDLSTQLSTQTSDMEDSRNYASGNAGDEQHTIELTMADYLATGGLAKALSNHAENVYSNRLTNDHDRRLAEQMFRRLTGVAPNGELVRQSPAPEFSKLCERLQIKNDEELKNVVDEFRSEGRSFIMPPPNEVLKAHSLIDISHESLIRKWPRLQEWTRDEARTSEVRQEISKAAANWDDGGRKPEDSQVPKSRLLAALEWSESHPYDITPQVRDFLAACKLRDDNERLQEQELQDSRRKNRLVIAVATVFLAMAGIALWSRFQSVEQKKKTETVLAEKYWRDAEQRLQGNSTAGTSGDLAAGLMWLVEAYLIEPSLSGSKQELYETRFSAAFAQHPKMCQLWHHEGLSAMTTSEDGRYLVTAGKVADKFELRIWDTKQVNQTKPKRQSFEIDDEVIIDGIKTFGEGEHRYLLAAMGKKGSGTGALSVWHWPQSVQLPIPIDKPLITSGPVLTTDFLPPTNGSTKPGIVALIEEENTTVVKHWSSVDESPSVLHSGVDEAPIAMLAVERGHGLVAGWGSDAKGQSLHIWNVKDLKADAKIAPPPTTAIQLGAFSSSGEFLVTLDVHGTAWLRETATGKIVTKWIAHNAAPLDVAFGPDDRHIVSTGDDKATKLWQIDLRNSEEELSLSRPKFEWAHESSITRVRFSPDGRWVATAGRDRVVSLWNVETGKAAAPPLHHAFGLASLAFLEDGNHVLTQVFNTVHLWQLSTDNPPSQELSIRSVNETAFKFANSPSCEFEVVFAEIKDAINPRIEGRVWDLVTGASTHSQPLTCSSSSPLSYVCISNDGSHVLTVAQRPQQELQLWDVRSGQSKSLNADGLGSVQSAAFSPDGQYVITANEAITESSSAPSTSNTATWQLQVWSVETGEPQLQNPEPQVGPVNHVVWSAKDNLVVISAGNASDQNETKGGAKLWQWQSNERKLVSKQEWQHEKKDKSSNAVLFAAFSPDNKFVATGGADDTAYLWSVESWKPVSPSLCHSSDIVHVAFSKDGSQLATSSIADKKSCVWDVVKAKKRSPTKDEEVKILKYTFDHAGRVNQSTFSADGNYLVTVSEDQTARVWSLISGGDSAAVFKHDGNVHAARFTDDGKSLITVSHNRGPHRSEWRLKIKPKGQTSKEIAPEEYLPFGDHEKLRDFFRLLGASELDAKKAVFRPLLTLQGSLTSEAARAEEALRLWESCGIYLTPRGSKPPTHLQSADACEKAGQWFAAAWHLERALRDAPDVNAATAEEKRTFSDLNVRCGGAIMRQEALDESHWQKIVGLFSKAIAFEPESWQNYAARASVFAPSNKREELRQALADYDEAIRLTSSPQRELYDSRARINGKLGLSEAAVADWTEAINLSQSHNKPLLRSLRGENYALLKDWSLARSDFESQFNATSALSNGYDLVLTQLKMGDLNAYQETFNKLHTRFANNASTSEELNTLAWLCVLAPNSIQNYETVIKLFKPKAEKALQGQTANDYVYLNTFGALHFRAGNWNEAKKWLNLSRKEELRNREKMLVHDATSDIRQSNSTATPAADVVRLSDDAGTIWDWIFLAMTFKQQGDVASAKKLLKLSQDRFESDSQVDSVWTRRVELEILLAEATQSVNGK